MADQRNPRFRIRAKALSTIVVGATFGGIVGLVLFGYPPARLVLPQDGPEQCAPPDEAAVWLAEELNAVQTIEATGAAVAEFEADRCGPGLRVWGTPLRSQARLQWLAAVDEIVSGAHMARVTDSLFAEREQLSKRRGRLQREHAQELAELEVALAGLAVRSAISVIQQERSDIDAADVLDLASEVAALEGEMEGLDEERAVLRARLHLAQRVHQVAAVRVPPSGLFHIALGAILGGMAAVVAITGLRLARTSGTDRPLEDDH